MSTNKAEQIQAEAREVFSLLTSSYLRLSTFLLTLLTVGLLGSMWVETFNFIFDNNAWDTFLSTLRLAIATPLLVLVFVWQVKSLKLVLRKARAYTPEELEMLKQNAVKAAIGGCVAAWGVSLFIVPIAIYVALTLPMISQLSDKE
jgi:hypothetical protein